MKTIVHLSDLHFGRVDRHLLDPLVDAVTGIRPDLVAVSGDLTQRARGWQFRQARAFLDRLPQPQLVVPGNHDVPLENLLARFANPLGKYRRYITHDLDPFHQDGKIAVLGINTSRSLTISGGRISHRQLALIESRLATVPKDLVRIIVTHHPFDTPAGHERQLVGHARRAMHTFARCRVDLLLSGHLHLIHTRRAALRYADDDLAALVVQAGTATSNRRRGEVNSFNVIMIAPPYIDVQRYEWHTSCFQPGLIDRFEKRADGWWPIAPTRLEDASNRAIG